MSAFFCKNSALAKIVQRWFFCCFHWKYPFLTNLFQKIKIVSLSWNLVPRVIWISRHQWWCSLFSVFDWRYPFWANLVQKTKIVSFRWNLTPRLIRICNSVYLVCFRLEILSLDKLGPKNQNCQFKLKFGSDINSNMQNSMVIFTFFVFDWRYPFWANLV